ncbi:MAG: Dot/Icm T4SS effector AnkH/LegA3 [Gammaproteobacteria bacterium]
MMRSLADEIIYGNFSGVETLVQRGADVNEDDQYGFTPLIETAIVDRPDSIAIAQFLLSKGADVNGRSILGHTALHWAVENHNLPLCKLLLEHHANPNAYTFSSQPLLLMPFLRQQDELKHLLSRAGASLEFTQDFVNTKLLGHRYELSGKIDIVNGDGHFVEVDVEGFFFEVTLGIIQNSLKRYRYHYAAKHLQEYFEKLDKIIQVFEVAAQLLKYQQYKTDRTQYQPRINQLLSEDLLLLPIAFKGHAVTYIKYRNLWVRCDRGEFSRQEGSVIIYEVTKPAALTHEFLQDLMYKRHSREFINRDMKKILGLKAVMQLPLESQVTGNCSWANVEASIPTLLFLQLLSETTDPSQHEMIFLKQEALNFYKQWQEWDKDTALYECIQSFYYSNPARKASKAALLGAVLFNIGRGGLHTALDLSRAKKILRVLMLPEYDYVIKIYLNIYGHRYKQLLESCDVFL